MGGTKSQEPSSFGIVIEFYLEKKRMTRADLARELKVSPAAVTKWMTGKNSFKLAHLENILKVFKIDFKDFAETTHQKTSWGKFSQNYPH